DIALIKAMGFDHVRLSVNPQPMFRRGQADRIPADYLGYLDVAVKMILDQGLGVIVDIHPDSDFKQKLVAEDSFVEQFGDYWRALARHYSSTNPELVSFEVLNEPEFHDRYRWQGVQAKLAVAIREGAPQHTIIVAGAYWSSENELLFFDPLRDPNIIYNFHFYDPHIFTHQGATWSTNYVHYLKELPYPSTPENVQAAAALIPDAVNRLQAIHYGLDRWNAAGPSARGLCCAAAAGPVVLPSGNRLFQNHAAIFSEAAVGRRNGGGGRREDCGLYLDGGKSAAGARDHAGRGGVAPAARSRL